MIVLLTEEPSMSAFLESILPGLWPSSIRGVHWMVLSFQGKADLENLITRKLRQWHYGHPHFVILRDNDGGDCLATKQRLRDLAEASGKPFHVRIVCQQLESWLLGDLQAIERAYPRAAIRDKAKFRTPDRLANASQELEGLDQCSAEDWPRGNHRKVHGLFRESLPKLPHIHQHLDPIDPGCLKANALGDAPPLRYLAAHGFPRPRPPARPLPHPLHDPPLRGVLHPALPPGRDPRLPAPLPRRGGDRRRGLRRPRPR